MIDTALQRLASEPVPATLDEVERQVLGRLAGLAVARERQLPTGFGLVAASVALVLGIAAGAAPLSQAASRSSLSPLDAAGELAPSSLLLRAR